MNGRLARTSVPIHPPLAARWSPRAFDPSAVLGNEELTALLEAARWSATWGHREPVRYVVGTRGDETFTTLANLLKRGNSYARAAGALILVCADEGEDERTARYAAVDVGAAIASLSIEAVSRGLIAHPMAGFDTAAAHALTAGLRPFALVAVGSLGDDAAVDAAIVERDSRPRERLALEQIVLNWPSGPQRVE